MKILRVTLLCGVFIAVIPLGVFSQTSDQELEAEEIFHEYMSPFCLGRLLADCRSDEAGELRDEIRSALARGISSERIREQLEQTYGVGIRASPKFSGWGLLAWLATPAFFAAALALVGSWIFRQRGNAANGHPCLTSTSDGVDEQLLKRLWEELSNGR